MWIRSRHVLLRARHRTPKSPKTKSQLWTLANITHYAALSLSSLDPISRPRLCSSHAGLLQTVKVISALKPVATSFFHQESFLPVAGSIICRSRLDVMLSPVALFWLSLIVIVFNRWMCDLSPSSGSVCFIHFSASDAWSRAWHITGPW